MANATYFKTLPKQLHVTHLPCRNGEEFSLTIPSAPRHGPPTSSPVQVNLGNSSAGFFTVELPANRVRDAGTTIIASKRAGSPRQASIGGWKPKATIP